MESIAVTSPMTGTIRNDGKGGHLAAGAGDAVWFAGQLITYKVRVEGMSLFELAVGPYGGAPSHLHRSQDETHYILEGRYTFRSDARRIEVGPGSVVQVARGVVHAFTHLSPGWGRMLCVVCPPGPLERFLDEAGQPARDRSVPLPDATTMEQLLDIARRTGGLELASI
jgi:quercetin dioxygenase-like cupin family protein